MDSTVIVNEGNPKKGVTGTTLKIIAIVTMFIDHFAGILVSPYLDQLYERATDLGNGQGLLYTHPEILAGRFLYFLMSAIGRFGFPIFAFLLVEGFTHTRSVAKYARNLAIFAIISELPFNLALGNKLFYPVHQNVFFTLFLGLICIWMIDKFAFNRQCPEKLAPLSYLAAVLLGAALGYFFTRTWIIVILWKLVDVPNYCYYIAGAVIALIVHLIVSRQWDTERKNRYTVAVFITLVFAALATALGTDYNGIGIMTIIILYLYRANKKKAFALSCVILTIHSLLECAAFLMLIPISKYNGERGKTINKYFFYAFYPVHLGLLYLVAYLLGIAPFAIK